MGAAATGGGRVGRGMKEEKKGEIRLMADRGRRRGRERNERGKEGRDKTDG